MIVFLIVGSYIVVWSYIFTYCNTEDALVTVKLGLTSLLVNWVRQEMLKYKVWALYTELLMLYVHLHLRHFSTG